MYVITGATGHIGNRIANLLLDKGKEVRVIGRDSARLKALVAKGAKPSVGTLDDAKFVSDAFAGADGAFCMIPPDMQAKDIKAFQKRISESMIAAVKTAHVKCVVNLSSIGAELDHGNGPIAGLHDHEERGALRSQQGHRLHPRARPRGWRSGGRGPLRATSV